MNQHVFGNQVISVEQDAEVNDETCRGGKEPQFVRIAVKKKKAKTSGREKLRKREGGIILPGVLRGRHLSTVDYHIPDELHHGFHLVNIVVVSLHVLGQHTEGQ